MENSYKLPSWQERSAMMMSVEQLAALAESRVVILGCGGVGGYAAEMLARAGVGHFVLVDADEVSESNINRQIIALHSTIGQKKTALIASRIRDINPQAEIIEVDRYLEKTQMAAFVEQWHGAYFVDAIDTFGPKMALIIACLGAGERIVSAMGAGAKIDATRIRIADISKTVNCPLARVVRKRLRKEAGIRKGLRCVFSDELPIESAIVPVREQNKNSQTGTMPYLPAAFGIIIAQAVISDLCNC